MSTGRLTPGDSDVLLRAIGSMAEFRDLDSLRHHTVEMLADLVSSNGVAWNEVSPVDGPIAVVMEPDLYSDENAAVFMAHIGEHPVISRFTETGDGRPYAISDFLSAREFHATTLYREFYRHFGAEDQIAFELPEHRFIIGIAINRPRRGFTAGERRLLNAMRPHLAQAYRNAEDFSRLQRSVTAMETLVERAGEGLLLLDRSGTLEQCSLRARETLARWFDGWTGDILPEVLRAWLEAGRRRNAPATPLLTTREGARLMIRRVAVPDGDALLVTETRSDRASGQLAVLGLTNREAEVLLAVTEGRSTTSVASALGISPRTVEKHLQHVYDKLGLENRIAATNLVRQLERHTPST